MLAHLVVVMTGIICCMVMHGQVMCTGVSVVLTFQDQQLGLEDMEECA